MIMKVAKGKGIITVNVKTSGNAQLVVQVGNGVPMLATKIYDLQGRRVENPGKGLYIIGGRKISVK